MQLYSENYKLYTLVPLVLFLLFLFMIFVYPGISRGMDLTGGTLVIIRSEKPLDERAVETLLSERFELTDLDVVGISSPAGYGLNIQFAENRLLSRAEAELNLASSLIDSDADSSAIHSQSVLSMLSAYVEEEPPKNPRRLLEFASATFAAAREGFLTELKGIIASSANAGGDEILMQSREVGPTLGALFWESAVFVSIIAFLLLVAVIFFFFRQLIPSAAVIFAALFDIAGALALMALFGIPLSLSSIPALLMLIGYSVDTDIMLTSRLLKRKENTPRERTIDSMATGLTMTFTTLAAVSVMLVFSFMAQTQVVFEISAVILFGLMADIISTWMMNAPMLLWFVERQRVKSK